MKHLKKALLTLFTVSLVFVLSVFVSSYANKTDTQQVLSLYAKAETVYSGNCGNNATWTLDNSGTLKISGNGAIDDYPSISPTPWNSYKTSIKNVIIEPDVTSIGIGAFSGCNNLTSITIPDSVTEIGDNAFYDCISLARVTIPKYVTNIGIGAFYNCTSLSSINIPDSVTDIGEWAFYDCNSLTNIKIPDSVTNIGNGAFIRCKSLTSITIPDSISGIGDSTFLYCISLTNIIIPDSILNIGDSAFYGCNNLKNILYTGTSEQWNNINIGSDNSDFTNANIYNNSGLIIENGVVYNKDKTSIIFYDSTKNNTSLSIPSTVKTIETNVFNDCTELTDIYFGGTQKEWDSITIGPSNSVISTVNLHFEHSHTFGDWEVLIPAQPNIDSVEINCCIVCGYEKKVTVAWNHTHNYKCDIITPATCLADGEAYYSCDCTLDYIKKIAATGHLFTNETADAKHLVSAANCTDKAVYYCKCENCDVFSDSVTFRFGNVDTNAHIWNNGEITTNATCSVKGIKTYTCQINNKHTYTEDLGFNTTKHIKTKNTSAVAATCSDIGYTAGVYCEDCKDYASGHKKLPVNGNAHNWNNGKVTTVATCSVKGVKTYTCQRNNQHTYTKDLGFDTSNHVNQIKTNAVSANCSKSGYTAGVYCNDCKTYTSGHVKITADANKHNWDNGKVTTTATCSVKGVKVFTCKHNSKHTYTEDLGLKTTNHVNQIKTNAVSATCSKSGYTVGIYCNDCKTYISGHVKIATDANKHSWDNGEITKTATCTVKGVKVFTCKHNSKHTYTEDLGLKTTNHVNQIKTNAVSANCSKSGYTAGVYCNDCKTYTSGHVKITTDKNKHSWNKGEITKTATCTVKGVKVFTCKHNSKHTYTEDLKLNTDNHVNIKKTKAVAATAKSVGYTEGVFCNDCQQYISGHFEIPKIKSSFKNGINAKLEKNIIRTSVNYTAAQLLSQASDSAYIMNSNGKKIDDNQLLCTGMNLVLPDDKEYTIIAIGDIDKNGKITAADARIALRIAAGLETYNKTAPQYLAGNVNGGKLVAADARLILRASAKLEDPKKWLK